MAARGQKSQEIPPYDLVIASLFAGLTIAVIALFFSSKDFFDWAFDRHHNVLSWYIRPLFILPIVYGAYRRSLSVIALSVFSLFTSMFWFPKPETVDSRVMAFLNFEKDYLRSGWTADKIFVTLAVCLFFGLLIWTTWTRRWGILLAVVILAAVLKVAHSLLFSGERGLVIVIPAVLGLLICVPGIGLILKQKAKGKRRD